jgi:hypothetical protein
MPIVKQQQNDAEQFYGHRRARPRGGGNKKNYNAKGLS